MLAELLVGVLLVELALLEVSAAVYTALEKPKHEVFAPIMPIYQHARHSGGVCGPSWAKPGRTDLR